MDVKEAVTKAKTWVVENQDLLKQDLLKDEKSIIENIGLEEIVFDHRLNQWKITIGFRKERPTNGTLSDFIPSPRIYKVVTLKEPDGQFVSLTNRTE